MQRRKNQDRRRAGGSSHLDHSVTSVAADRCCLPDVAAIYLVQHTRADRTAWRHCVHVPDRRSLRAVTGPAAARLLVVPALSGGARNCPRTDAGVLSPSQTGANLTQPPSPFETGDIAGGSPRVCYRNSRARGVSGQQLRHPCD